MRREQLCLDLAKKRTTSNADPQTMEQVSSPLPDQQAFHEHLRALTRHAVRMVIEEVMREELKQSPSSGLGRDNATTQGVSQRKLHPRPRHPRWVPLKTFMFEDDREGNCHTEVFERVPPRRPSSGRGASARCLSPVEVPRKSEKWRVG
jgi:putative transposase